MRQRAFDFSTTTPRSHLRHALLRADRTSAPRALDQNMHALIAA
jgi:hypothetical protein